MREITGWSDDNEKDFLRTLGKWQNPESDNILSRRHKLEGYIASIPKRENWGKMNRDTIKTFAEYQLAEENAQACN